MKDKFQSKAVPRGTRTIWRYLSALLILFTFAIGNVWAADPDLAIGTDAQTSSSFLGEYSTQGITLSSSVSYSSGAVQLGNTPSSYDQHYFEVLSSSAEIEKVSFLISGNGSNKSIQAPVFAWASTATSNTADTYVLLDAVTVTANSYAAAKWFEYDLSGASVKCARIYRTTKNISSTDPAYTGSSTALGSGQTIKIYGIKVWLKASSGPVDPTLIFDDGVYTLGGSDLDLSTLITSSNSDGEITYVVKSDDDGTGASISGTTFIADAPGTVVVTATQAATSSYNTKSVDFNVVVSAPETPECPSGISISGTDTYTEGETISLTATLTEGNGEIAFSWYKGALDADHIIDGANSNILSIPNCSASDAGNYFCLASKPGCSLDAESSAFAVTVNALVACTELVPATSGDAPAAGNAISLTTATGGSMKALSANLTYTASGLQFGTNSGTKASVTLNHLMQEGTMIRVTLVANGTGARGLKLYNAAGSNQVASLGWSSATNGEEKSFTYTVTASDQLNGTNGFQLWRNNTVTLKSLQIFNCGAELFALNSAIYPAEAEGKATITLSKNFVENGGTATATYSAINALYDFDEWVINGATIDDAHANPVTITMGSNPATITLKLKEAGTKYAVHFDSKGGSAIEDQLVDEGGYASVPTAPTKFKYTFGGWSEIDGGSIPANLNEIAINAEKTFFAIWTDKVCPTSGTIFSLSQNGSKPSSEIKWTNADNEGVRDVSDFFEVVNGIAALVNNSSSNNQVSITTDPKMKISNDANGWLHLRLECALEEGDVITLDNNSKCIVSYTADKAEGTTYTLPNSSSHTITVPASWDGQDELWFFRQGGGLTITSISITRPAHFAVTFNMHDHGDAVDPQSVVEGGKVTKPTDPTASGWDFGGWFTDDTYGTTWDFENMTISAATEIHALWTVHTTSTDASLSDLQVNGVTVPGFSATVTNYNVELPMGISLADVTITGTTHDANAEITQIDYPSELPGTAMVTVRAEDGTTLEYYTLNLTVATTRDLLLVFKTGSNACVGTPSTATQILSNNAAVSSYINQITFTNVEGAGDNGAEGSSLNVGKKAGNMFTLTAKPGYAFQAMNFLAKIQDATCEYSIDGSDWTTLASTNTGGDDCYQPFSGTEVHEFRLRSTGASGVWIRNMQLTIIEACTPIVVAWDEEPVEFEVGKAGYAIAATANNGGDITYATADNTIIDVNASTGALTIADLGSVALSASTPEGDGTTYCANGGDPIVISSLVNTYFLVTLDAQNGEAPAEIKFFSGDAAIAEPSDPVFAGHTFLEWQDANNEPIAWPLTPDASLTLHATWQSDCNAPQIVEHPESANYFTGRAADALECQATAQNNPDGELSYVWYSCDNASRENPVALSGAPTPSTAVAGTFYFYCDVTEEGCANVAHSDVAVITVADKDPICLAWVDVTGQNAVALDASKSLYAPEVSAAGIKNSSSYGERTGWKFNSSPAYIAIEGAPFKSGDIVEMFVTTTTADKARVFNANEAIAANIIAEGTANMVLGANRVALTADANNLYLRRADDFGGWNPYVAYVAVYRACAPILNKVTVVGVDGTPDNTNHVAIEVPFSTADAALDAIAYDWISNNADWTASHSPAVANTWEWGVENTVTLTDKDGDASVYYVTISKAAASSDASLASLTVNGQNVEIVPDQLVYNVELPYGTSVAPVVAATANHSAAVANVIECDLNSAIIEVVPESGVDDKVEYTINFTISKWQEVVIWDGSYMTELATSPDAATGFAWAVNGFGSIANYAVSYAAKDYVKCLPSGGSASSTRNIELTVPAGYVAKFYVVGGSHSDKDERSAFIATSATKTDTQEGILTIVSPKRIELAGGTSEIVGAGTYYINPAASFDFYEIRAYLRPGFARTDMVGNGVLGTVCLNHNVAAEDVLGASVYELAGRIPPYGKLAFDEIVAGQMNAGVPHVFQAHGNRVVFFYGEQTADEPQNQGNGIYGTFTEQVFSGDELEGMYYFAERALWSCKDISSLTVPANRAYVILTEVPDANPDPAPGRRRIVFDVHGEQTATDVENINNASEQPQKLMINGKIFILRGERLFDATGRLVK